MYDDLIRTNEWSS